MYAWRSMCTPSVTCRCPLGDLGFVLVATWLLLGASCRALVVCESSGEDRLTGYLTSRSGVTAQMPVGVTQARSFSRGYNVGRSNRHAGQPRAQER